MNRKLLKNVLTVAIPLLIICIVGIYLVNTGIITDEPPNTNSKMINTSLTIDYGNGEIDTYNIETSNATVFSVLMKASEDYNFPVTTKSYNQNQSYYIDSIKSVTNGEDGKYWMYYLNGNYGTVGADMQTVADGDVIEWRFE